MEFLHTAADFILHLDDHLQIVIQDFGLWTYLMLFLIIFAETGFVITPFLPGDSLIFAVGTLSATGMLNPLWLFIILSSAAILGNSLNYAIGQSLGPKVFNNPNSRILKKEYLDKTHQFFEKYGAKTIILTRFMPIVRTFAPFVAGVGSMSYPRFIAYNILGAVLWVGLFVCKRLISL